MSFTLNGKKTSRPRPLPTMNVYSLTDSPNPNVIKISLETSPSRWRRQRGKISAFQCLSDWVTENVCFLFHIGPPFICPVKDSELTVECRIGAFHSTCVHVLQKRDNRHLVDWSKRAINVQFDINKERTNDGCNGHTLDQKTGLFRWNDRLSARLRINPS